MYSELRHWAVALVVGLGGAEAAAQEDVAPCLTAVPSSQGAARWDAAMRSLARADGSKDVNTALQALATISEAGHLARSAAAPLVRQLAHSAPLYRNRDKGEVVRLRAHILTTLTDIGAAQQATGVLHDVLAHLDDRNHPLEAAAAARAAGSLGPNGREFVPYLLAALPLTSSSLEVWIRPRCAQAVAAATTLQLEALSALDVICTSGGDKGSCSVSDVEALTIAAAQPRTMVLAQRLLDHLQVKR